MNLLGGTEILHHVYRLNYPSHPSEWPRRRNIRSVIQDETAIIDDIQLPSRRHRLHNHPPAILHDETALFDGLPPVRRLRINVANLDDVRRRFMDPLPVRDTGEEERKNVLSGEIWRYLSTAIHKQDECGGGFCTVCQSEFENSEKLGSLRCGHEYHATCIHTWLMQKNICPVCKRTAIAELES